MVEEMSDDRDSCIDQENDPTLLFGDITELWRDLPGQEDPAVIPGVADLITDRTLPHILNDLLYSEIRTSDMTNLGNILLGYPPDGDPMHDDCKIGRLSLAHEKLTYMPKMICDEFGPHVKILDICDNNIKNLDFLEYFTELNTLIADKNPINATETNIPWMPKLELLYLNHCKIDEPYWIETLRYNCPNLKYLSLMGNPVAPPFGNIYEYLRYRLYVISVIPSLVHLDDRSVTSDERMQAKRMYPTPVLQNFYKATKARIPHCFRRLTGNLSKKMFGRRKNKSKDKRRTLASIIEEIENSFVHIDIE